MRRDTNAAGQSRRDVQAGEVRRSALYISSPYKAETHRNGVKRQGNETKRFLCAGATA
jgi:hypothetical protein